MKKKNPKKIFSLNIIFKNLPGKGTGKKLKSKKAWFSNNLKNNIICIQEVKSKTHEKCLEWFPTNWHDGIFTSLMQDTKNAQGGVLIAINPHSDLKVLQHYHIIEGRVLAIELLWKDFLKFT